MSDLHRKAEQLEGNLQLLLNRKEYSPDALAIAAWLKTYYLSQSRFQDVTRIVKEMMKIYEFLREQNVIISPEVISDLTSQGRDLFKIPTKEDPKE